MAIKCNPAQLSEELAAAGLTSVANVRNGGPLDTIVWAHGHPTPAEQATADAVLAAHDPDADSKDEAARQAELAAALPDLDSPNAAMRDAAQTRIIKVLAYYAIH